MLGAIGCEMFVLIAKFICIAGGYRVERRVGIPLGELPRADRVRGYRGTRELGEESTVPNGTDLMLHFGASQGSS